MKENSSRPLVSVLIPLYNQERYFDACMRSVCNQTYKNLEIIVINDGSTDRSPEMARRWAEQDSRVKYLDQKNTGAAMARWHGYRVATGEFITPLDSDDYLAHNAIEIMAGHMMRTGVDMVQGSMARVMGLIKRQHYFDTGTFPFDRIVKQPELFDDYYLNFFGKSYFPIMMCGKLYRKSAIDRAMKETKLCSSEFPFVGEDHYFNMKLFPYLRSMYRTNETVYYYRYGGMSSSRFSPTYPALLALSDKRLALLDHYQLNAGYESLFREYVDIMYYHAQQLIEFKKGEKDDVINFFKDELSSRKIACRLIDFFANHSEDNERINLMINHDYEGMYNLANRLLNARRNSIKQRCKRILLKVLDMLE